MRRVKRGAGTEVRLAADLAALPDLPLADLKARWATLYGSAPPARLSRAILVRAIAYRLQERVHGGLSPVVKRRLMGDERSGPRRHRPRLSAGTRLLREWQGVTHEVMVLDDGVSYAGQTWRSLSAVARAITGTRWSGPAFFGIKANGPGA